MLFVRMAALNAYQLEAGMTEKTRRAVHDPERLQTLRETGLLDSEVEEQFDRLTRLASKLLGAPATFFSLVDEDRDFYKSCFGFSEPLASDREIEGVTFCHYSIVSDGALVIPDTRADPVYREVPTVKSLGVAAYLGVPVRAPDGQVLGSFCAIDFEPRDWSQLEVETMKELATSAEREVAIRHWMRRQSQLIDRERSARRELERALESRSRLMRGFTHDVKNPLGAGDGFLALLEEEILGPLSAEQKQSIARVRRSIGTALGLIDELITIARTEAGDLEIEIETVDLRTVAEEIADEYRAQAEASGLRIELRLPDTLPPVQSSATRIRQILGNLVSNAVKYTRQGSITLSAAVQSDSGADGTSEWAALHVTDTGPGIAPEHLGLLFEEFTRFEPETTQGAGLGLAISHRIAAAVGGRLAVESEVNRGSTFSLWLPVGTPRQPTEQDPQTRTARQPSTI